MVDTDFVKEIEYGFCQCGYSYHKICITEYHKRRKEVPYDR
jgi:hypothetical protein